MAKTIQDLLLETQALKEKEKAIKQEMKAKKLTIAKDYIDGLDDKAKAKQIDDAKAILEKAQAKKIQARQIFKDTLSQIKKDITLAKNILEFVNYKQGHSLPKTKNSYVIDGKIATIKREGIQDIKIDITKADWQKTMKAELKKQGINGDDRVADNMIYKLAQLVNTHNAQG